MDAAGVEVSGPLGSKPDIALPDGSPPSDLIVADLVEGEGPSAPLPGLRVGGRRLLVVPPQLGYGTASPTPAIASNDTLVFVIDLVGVG